MLIFVQIRQPRGIFNWATASRPEHTPGRRSSIKPTHSQQASTKPGPVQNGGAGTAPDNMGNGDQQTSTVQAAALAVSGGLAGGVAKTTVAPLERVKLLLQTGECRAVTTCISVGRTRSFSGNLSRRNARAPP